MKAPPWWGAAAVLTAFSLGVISAVLLQPITPWLLLTILLAAAIVVIRRELLVLAVLMVLAASLGAGRALLADPVHLPAELIGRQVAIAGTVEDDPVSRRNGTRLVVAVRQVDDQLYRGLRLVTTVYGGRVLHYGDSVLISGRLKQPDSREQFDYRTYLADQGISAILESPRLIRSEPGGGDAFHALLFSVRRGLVQAVDRALPEPQAALLLGVVFGYRAALPHQLEQQMIASGLIHIVVISGLKVSLLARIVHQSLGRFVPRAAPIVALVAMVVYALLAGASAAALRAAAMGALVVLAGTFKRDSHVYTSMALTAAIMLGLKPALAHDVSFQLSFAGTLGIASLTDPIAARLPWIPGVLRDPLAATVAAEAATWPLMLANFHQVSFIAPLANALVLPLLPAIMVIGGAGAIIGSVAGPLGWPALQIAGVIASWFRIVIEWTASVPLANLTAPYFPPRWLAAAALLNAGALSALKLRTFFWQKKVWAVLGGATLLVSALLLVSPDGRVHVYALDVGTGSAVLIRTGNGEQVLFDSGPDPDKFAQAIGRALPSTARTLKLWVITGGRRIQIGAGSAVLSRFHVERIVVADPDPWTPTLRSLVERALARHTRVEATPIGLNIDGLSLSPAAEERGWRVRYGGAELAIVPREGFALISETIIYTGGGPESWELTPPKVAIIQVAANSRDGLPARAFLRALQGTSIQRTDRSGTIEVIAADGGFRLTGS
jgi:competence protein ComEC